MAKKLINTVIKLGENTLVIEALTSLGIDFVMQRGSNSNGEWEKWFSGKLVQKTAHFVIRTEISTIIEYTWTFPVPFVGDRKIIVYSGTFDCIHQGVAYRDGVLGLKYGSSPASRTFSGADRDKGTFNDYSFYLEAKGRWK